MRVAAPNARTPLPYAQPSTGPPLGRGTRPGVKQKHRRCVRNYGIRFEHAEAMVHLAMIMTMARRLAR